MTPEDSNSEPRRIFILLIEGILILWRNAVEEKQIMKKQEETKDNYDATFCESQ